MTRRSSERGEELYEERQQEGSERGQTDLAAPVGDGRRPPEMGSRAVRELLGRAVGDSDHDFGVAIVLQRTRLDRDCVGAASIELRRSDELTVKRAKLLHVGGEPGVMPSQLLVGTVACGREREVAGEEDDGGDEESDGDVCKPHLFYLRLKDGGS